MNGKLCDVPMFINVDAAVLRDACDNLIAFVVLLQGEDFEPMATIVFQRPCHEANVSRCVVDPFTSVFTDAAHLLTMCHRILTWPVPEEIRLTNDNFSMANASPMMT